MLIVVTLGQYAFAWMFLLARDANRLSGGELLNVRKHATAFSIVWGLYLVVFVSVAVQPLETRFTPPVLYATFPMAVLASVVMGHCVWIFTRIVKALREAGVADVPGNGALIGYTFLYVTSLPVLQSRLNRHVAPAVEATAGEGTFLARVPSSHVVFRTGELSLEDAQHLLLAVLNTLQSLGQASAQIRVVEDWLDHDGLEFPQGLRPLSFLFSIAESHEALLANTPDDDLVFLRAESADGVWTIRVRTEEDANDQERVGELMVSIPADASARFISTLEAKTPDARSLRKVAK
jgi:hypothetical protein